jgi:hypothetical protein
MNPEQLFLKLKIRKFLLKQRACATWRGQLFGNFRNTPGASRELFDAVINACVAEGTITVSKGQKGGELLTWHEEAIKLEVGRG